MSTAELKAILIEEITASDNGALLKEILHLKESENEDLEPNQLSTEQLSPVSQAQVESKAGKVLTDEEANREINEWLEKQYGHYGLVLTEKSFSNIGTSIIDLKTLTVN